MTCLCENYQLTELSARDKTLCGKAVNVPLHEKFIEKINRILTLIILYNLAFKPCKCLMVQMPHTYIKEIEMH